MRACGRIDLDSDNSVVGLTGEQDKVRYRKRLTKNFSIILEALGLYRHALQGLVVESIYNWYWLVDGLMEAGYCLLRITPQRSECLDCGC